MTNQLAPHNIEAEESVLGSVLLNPKAYEAVKGLTTDDFYIVRHGWIWEGIAAVLARNDPLDNVTVCDELKRAGRLEEVGGVTYVLQLLNDTPTSLHAEGYANIVRRHAKRRRQIVAASKIAQLAHNQTLDEAETDKQMLEVLADTFTGRSAAKTQEQVVGEMESVLWGVRQGKLRPSYVEWGLPVLETALGYTVETGTFAIVAGKKGSWKSHILAHVMAHMARDGGPPILQDDKPIVEEGVVLRGRAPGLVVTQEMTAGRLLARAARDDSRLSDKMLYEVGVSREQAESHIEHAKSRMRSLPILWLDVTAKISAIETELKARPDIRWVCVDSLDKLHDVRFGRDAKVERVKEAASQLARLSHDYGVHVFATKEVNRAGELSYAGDFDADIVLYVWPKKDMHVPGMPGYIPIEVEVDKNREGPDDGKPWLAVHRETLELTELTDEHQIVRRSEYPAGGHEVAEPYKDAPELEF